MACCANGGPSLLCELKDLVSQIGDSCDDNRQSCQQPRCAPCNFPFAQVVMTCPPPILAPTRPEPVKPLQLPCPCPNPSPPPFTPEENERSRYNNFYNNYNIDWHNDSASCRQEKFCSPTPPHIKKPEGCCEDYTKRDDDCSPLPGCPTGFKPCSMKLTPPPCCNPCGIWCAQVQPCPAKPKKKDNRYVPGPCRRPCCKHWQPKEGPCLYDDPCKADCFNHPPGMKPSGRYP